MAEGAITRRRFLEGAGAAGVAIAGATVWRTAPAAAQARRVAAVDTPIRHLVIACQENRSFDHYYGYAPSSGLPARDKNSAPYLPYSPVLTARTQKTRLSPAANC
jgi:phospholipase C